MTFEDRRTCPRCVGGDELVEIPTTHDVAVLRVDRMRRPFQFELPAHAGGAQTREAVELVELFLQPHVDELLDGAGRQPVTACLLAGEPPLLDDRDVVAVPGQPVGGAGTGRSSPDDENVGHPGGDPAAGASPIGMISMAWPSALVSPASASSASVVPSSSATNAGASSEHHVSNSSTVVVRGRVGAAERVALVADNGEDLGVGQVTASGLTLWRHDAERAREVRSTRAVRVPVVGDAGEVVLGRPEVDEAQLVLDVRERQQHLAVHERSSDASLTLRAMAATRRTRTPRRLRRVDRLPPRSPASARGRR